MNQRQEYVPFTSGTWEPIINNKSERNKMNQQQIDQIMQGILEKVMSGDMAGFDMTVEGLSHDTCIQIIKNFGRQAAQAAAMYGEQLGIK